MRETAVLDEVTVQQLRKYAGEGVQLLIDGELRKPQGQQRFGSVDPFSGETWYEAANATSEDVNAAVESAHVAQSKGPWSTYSAYERGRIMNRIADLIEQDADLIGALDTLDNGKLFRETRAQAVGVARSLRYHAGMADKITGFTAPTDAPQTLALTLREPYGVIAAIVPWNSPVPLLVGTAAPALAAGNAVVVKAPEIASASLVHFAQRAIEAGLPPGVLNVITGMGAEAGEALITHPAVGKIVFTGGNVVGQQVAATAARRSVPVMLELGGKSAQIILPDADLDRAVLGLISGVFAAAGQTCVAGGRALVHASIYDEVLERLANRAQNIVLGDPLDPATEMGPLGSDGQLQKALHHVQRAIEQGADLVSGGKTRSTGLGKGEILEPTVFSNVDRHHELFQEEVFGPIIGLTPFNSIDEAVDLANDSKYGLAGSVWTQDIDQALNVAKQIQAGTIWINTYRAPEFTVPLGGYKESGYGRLEGPRAVYEFTREKTLIINHSGIAKDPFVMLKHN